MATWKIEDIRRIGRDYGKRNFSKTAKAILDEHVQKRIATKAYDIFLSHSFSDAEIILGMKTRLEQYNYSVYVDWAEDTQLDRSKVSPKTAALLRERMNQCKSLFYATTENSITSKWMPWECGYFDGKIGKTAILPLTTQGGNQYQGQEYLGLYPYISEDLPQGGNQKILWVRQSLEVYCRFDSWLAGTAQPIKH